MLQLRVLPPPIRYRGGCGIAGATLLPRSFPWDDDHRRACPVSGRQEGRNTRNVPYGVKRNAVKAGNTDQPETAERCAFPPSWGVLSRPACEPGGPARPLSKFMAWLLNRVTAIICRCLFVTDNPRFHGSSPA